VAWPFCWYDYVVASSFLLVFLFLFSIRFSLSKSCCLLAWPCCCCYGFLAVAAFFSNDLREQQMHNLEE